MRTLFFVYDRHRFGTVIAVVIYESETYKILTL